MHKALDVIGLPVLEVETGKKLGAVKDFLIDREGGFCGLLLDARQWYSSPRWISRDEILAIGDDAVTVRYEDSAPGMEERGTRTSDEFGRRQNHRSAGADL